MYEREREVQIPPNNQHSFGVAVYFDRGAGVGVRFVLIRVMGLVVCVLRYCLYIYTHTLV